MMCIGTSHLLKESNNILEVTITMTEEHLPEPFNEYWKMKKVPRIDESSYTNKENLSKEWNDFLLSVKKRVERDLNEK
jgi:hypothetical protein